MRCKCGAQMRRQSQGVFFCTTGDRFAVTIVGHLNSSTQWYSREGGVTGG